MNAAQNLPEILKTWDFTQKKQMILKETPDIVSGGFIWLSLLKMRSRPGRR